jgi:hypothetical protein
LSKAQRESKKPKNDKNEAIPFNLKEGFRFKESPKRIKKQMKKNNSKKSPPISPPLSSTYGLKKDF